MLRGAQDKQAAAELERQPPLVRVRDHGGDRADGGAQGISQAVDLVGEDLAGEDADTIELSLGGLSITSY